MMRPHIKVEVILRFDRFIAGRIGPDKSCYQELAHIPEPIRSSLIALATDVVDSAEKGAGQDQVTTT